MVKDNLIEVLHEMEDVTKLFKLEPFDIYLMGGSACMLGEYTISKIIRLAEKDIEDLNQIIPKCDKKVLNEIIDEIINRDDLFKSKKEGFIKNLQIFREKYNV